LSKFSFLPVSAANGNSEGPGILLRSKTRIYREKNGKDKWIIIVYIDKSLYEFRNRKNFWYDIPARFEYCSPVIKKRI
jgi:hypothetical protein